MVLALKAFEQFQPLDFVGRPRVPALRLAPCGGIISLFEQLALSFGQGGERRLPERLATTARLAPRQAFAGDRRRAYHGSDR
jgi:hypothetical protein